MEIREFIEARLAEDELWAKAASAGRDPEDGTVEGGVHWTWSVGSNWDPVQPDPLEPFMGGYGGQWSQPVILRSVEEWGTSAGRLPLHIAESDELRTADGAHIVRHDPARVLREVAAKRRMAEVAVAQWKAAELPPDGHRECAAARALAILQFLAEPFADHPDFDPAWRING